MNFLLDDYLVSDLTRRADGSALHCPRFVSKLFTLFIYTSPSLTRPSSPSLHSLYTIHSIHNIIPPPLFPSLLFPPYPLSSLNLFPSLPSLPPSLLPFSPSLPLSLQKRQRSTTQQVLRGTLRWSLPETSLKSAASCLESRPCSRWPCSYRGSKTSQDTRDDTLAILLDTETLC